MLACLFSQLHNSVFSRSYSIIGYWHHHVVYPSVCLSVTRCIVALMQSRCTRLKSCQRVPSRRLPICLFRHFCCRICCLATKCTGKKTSRRKRERDFFVDTDDHDCFIIIIAHYILLRTWADRRCELWSSRLSGFSFGAFINERLVHSPILPYTSRS